MFEVVTKLLLAKQLRFEKGSVTIFEQPSSILPTQSFVTMQKELEKIGRENVIYLAGKDAGEKWFTGMSKYKLGIKDVVEWGANIVTLTGWGEAIIKKQTLADKYWLVYLQNSVVGKLYGRSRFPVDHMFRGLIAGAAKFICKCDMDAVETKCVSLGNNICEFIVQPKEKFNFSDPLVKKQLTFE